MVIWTGYSVVQPHTRYILGILGTRRTCQVCQVCANYVSGIVAVCTTRCAFMGRAKSAKMSPNEANCAESTSIVEAQDSIQVTANSGARSRLDKGRGAARGGGTEPNAGPERASDNGQRTKVQVARMSAIWPPKLGNGGSLPVSTYQHDEVGGDTQKTALPFVRFALVVV